MIVVLGEFDFHPDDFQAAKALAAVVMSETVKEDGCIQYAFAADLVHSNRLTLGGHPKPAIRGHLKTGQRDS